MEELLTSFGPQYGVKLLGETKLDFWRNMLEREANVREYSVSQ